MLRRYGLVLVTASMTSVGCASGQSDTPHWPRQPSPSYPGSDQKTDSTQDPAQLAPVGGEPIKSGPEEMGSTLAKQYDGKVALDTLEGKATYYADSLAGNHTANGDIYDPNAFTAAHKKLPFGTVVRVVRTDTRQTTYARINDRGPFGPSDRIIDLSKAAAKQLKMMKAGVVPVRVEVIERPKKK